MFTDLENFLSKKQLILTSQASTNIIDLGEKSSLVPDILRTGLKIDLMVTSAFIGADAGESLYLTLQTATDEAFSSPVNLCHTNEIDIDYLYAGVAFYLDTIPIKLERYFRIYYNVTGTMVAGNISACFVLDRQTPRFGAGAGPWLGNLVLATDDNIPILTGDGQYISPF